MLQVVQKASEALTRRGGEVLSCRVEYLCACTDNPLHAQNSETDALAQGNTFIMNRERNSVPLQEPTRCIHWLESYWPTSPRLLGMERESTGQ